MWPATFGGVTVTMPQKADWHCGRTKALNDGLHSSQTRFYS